jgi:hypothetical protein
MQDQLGSLMQAIDISNVRRIELAQTSEELVKVLLIYGWSETND